MEILGASFVFLCDKNFTVRRDFGVLFSGGQILEIDDFTALSSRHNCPARFCKNSILLPSFANPHVHFEWSKNTHSLVYGNFGVWIDSIMRHRLFLLENFSPFMRAALNEQIVSGVGAVGAISSHAYDVPMLAESQIKVVLFNEILGGKEQDLDAVFDEFLARYTLTQRHKNPRFTPAVAIHAPYSVHHALARRVIDFDKHALLSTHFLESPEEAEFLDAGTGYFAEFHKKYLGYENPSSFFSREEFLQLFSGRHAIFAHCVQASDQDLRKIGRDGFVVSCPRSNKLLVNEIIEPDPEFLTFYGLGTDGKSSNANLNFLHELRAALFASKKHPLDKARELLYRATNVNYRALKIDSGEITAGKNADFCVFDFDESLGSADENQAPLLFLMHATNPSQLFVNGKNILKKDENV